MESPRTDVGGLATLRRPHRQAYERIGAILRHRRGPRRTTARKYNWPWHRTAHPSETLPDRPNRGLGILSDALVATSPILVRRF
jgi:hypothetical protein